LDDLHHWIVGVDRALVIGSLIRLRKKAEMGLYSGGGVQKKLGDGLPLSP